MTMLKSILLILTLKCKESTRLVSESLDRDMPFAQRWAVRLHAVSCRSCGRYAKQLRLMGTALRRYAAENAAGAHAGTALSNDARDRINRAIASQHNRDS